MKQLEWESLAWKLTVLESYQLLLPREQRSTSVKVQANLSIKKYFQLRIQTFLMEGKL